MRKDVTCVNNNVSTKDKIDAAKSNTKSKAIKNDLSAAAATRKEKQCTENAICVTVTPSSTRRYGYTMCSVNTTHGNGRSVRFNKSDEVFEYAPSEPIKT